VKIGNMLSLSHLTRHAKNCASLRFAHLCESGMPHLVTSVYTPGVVVCPDSVSMTHVCCVTCRVSVSDMLVTYPFKCGKWSHQIPCQKRQSTKENILFHIEIFDLQR